MLVTVRTFILCVAAALIATACGSSPPVQYFTLSTASIATPEDPAGAAILGLGPMHVPEYLNRSQIVTRGPGAEVSVDEFSHWAEPLDLALHRVVAADVDNLLDGVIVISFPYDAVIRSDVDYRVFGEIDRFDADRSGRVVLDVQWTIAKIGSGLVVPPRRSRYEARAARADDAGSVAEAMNDALREFSRDIADELASVL